MTDRCIRGRSYTQVGCILRNNANPPIPRREHGRRARLLRQPSPKTVRAETASSEGEADCDARSRGQTVCCRERIVEELCQAASHVR